MSQLVLKHQLTDLGLHASLFVDDIHIGEFDMELRQNRPCLIAVMNGELKIYTVAKHSPEYLTPDQQLDKVQNKILELHPQAKIVMRGVLTIEEYGGVISFKVGGRNLAILLMYPPTPDLKKYVLHVTKEPTDNPGASHTYFVDVDNRFLCGGKYVLSASGMQTLGLCILSVFAKDSK